MDIGSITSLGKLLIELTKEIKSFLTSDKSKNQILIDRGTLIEIYGVSKRIWHQSQVFHNLLIGDRSSGHHNLAAFIHEHPSYGYFPVKSNNINEVAWKSAAKELLTSIEEFGKLLDKLNSEIIDIYYPGLGYALTSTYLMDYLIHQLIEKFNATEMEERLGKLLSLHYDISRNLRNYHYLPENIINEQSEEQLINAIEYLSESISNCNKMIGEIIKDNWEFKNLIK